MGEVCIFSPSQSRNENTILQIKTFATMTKDTEVDFNVFVGAETGILKGVNVHNKGNIAKNFHNFKSLDKEYEITCASFGDGEGEILMGLRNQSVKVDS